MRPTLFRATLMAATLGLGGCAMFDGYGGISGGGGYYGASADRYYAAPYYGWYQGYYYPGTGYYVYDRGGARHRWSDRHRGYWEGRRAGHEARENWSGYRRDPARGRHADRRVGDGASEDRPERRDDGVPGDGRRRAPGEDAAGSGRGPGHGRWDAGGDPNRSGVADAVSPRDRDRGQGGPRREAPAPTAAAASPNRAPPSQPRVSPQAPVRELAPARQPSPRAVAPNPNLRDR